jgi:uncharacterized metal-binding protein
MIDVVYKALGYEFCWNLNKAGRILANIYGKNL